MLNAVTGALDAATENLRPASLAAKTRSVVTMRSPCARVVNNAGLHVNAFITQRP
jgi:hypothetical protein